MGDGLKKDMCDINHPGASVKDIDPELLHRCLPPHHCYACQYWAQHVEQSGDLVEIESLVSGFMRKNFLHWLVALSLLGKMSEALNT
jgi:hypothetical protein